MPPVPTARFVSSKFSFSGDKVTEVAGTLTLLGKTLPVTLKATQFNCYLNPMFKREVCGGDFETTIQRSQWGMGWGLNMGAPDTVRLLVQVEAIKQ
jgi:polyisoprenoid-binding protein YceI